MIPGPFPEIEIPAESSLAITITKKPNGWSDGGCGKSLRETWANQRIAVERQPDGSPVNARPIAHFYS